MTENAIQASKAEVVGARLFAERGYSATTTRELARGLGVTNGTFYHHYASKEALLLQICRSSLGRITEAVSEATSSVDDPLPRLKTLIGTHIGEMVRDQDLHKTMLVELRSLSGENLEEVTARRDEYGKIVRDAITAAQKGGVVRNDIDAHTLGLLLLNLLNWTIFWFDPAGSLSVDELADATTRLFLDGAGVRKRAR